MHTYRTCLEKSCGVPSLVMLLIFSMEFDEFKRPLTLFAPSFLAFSYSQHFEMHATTYNELLGALMASEWSDLNLDASSG